MVVREKMSAKGLCMLVCVYLRACVCVCDSERDISAKGMGVCTSGCVRACACASDQEKLQSLWAPCDLKVNFPRNCIEQIAQTNVYSSTSLTCARVRVCSMAGMRRLDRLDGEIARQGHDGSRNG